VDEQAAIEFLKNPVNFIRTFTDYEPYPYQEAFLLDESRYIAVRKGRQIGISQAVAWKAVHFAFTHPHSLTLIVSRSQRQSVELFEKVKETMSNEWLAKSIRRETWQELELTNDSRIIALPCGDTGDTIRGYTADLLIIDEAAFIPEDVFTAVEYATIRGGRVIMVSTPFGVKNRFYRAFKSPEWSTHHIPATACPDEKMKEAIEKKRLEEPYLKFQQEVMGEFVESATLFFDDDKIRKCLVDANVPPGGTIKFLGVDPARHGNDVGVIIEITSFKNKAWVSKILAWNNKPLTHYAGEIVRLNDENDYVRIYIDETALGGGVVDVLYENMPIKNKIEGVVLTQDKKSLLYTNLHRLIENGELAIPLSLKLSADLVASLSTIEYESLSSGKMKILGENDDFADALALAAWGVKRVWGTKKVKVW